MRRIVLMILCNLILVPKYMVRLFKYAKNPDAYSDAERFDFLRQVDDRANTAGHVTIEAHGLENIPKEDGYMYYPNHQGLYDVLALIQVAPAPFSVVMKQELMKIFGLKQILQCMRAVAIDRDDVRQAMKVIQQVTEEVKNGRNYLIFAEGTRTKNPNRLGTFKGGSFKAATKARCPIVPVALIDSYKVFDSKNTKPQTVKVYFLEPMTYEMYKDMKTGEIAALVQRRIDKVIRDHE